MKESAGWSQLVIRSSEACGRDDSRPCDGCAALGDVRSLCETVLADTHTRRDFCAQVGTAAAQQHALQPKSRSLYTDLIEPFGDPALCTPWADRTFLSPFQVILVNSGAHQVPVARYNEAMCQAARVLQVHARATEAIVAFRTTIPTFDNCHLRGKASPFASLAEAEMYIENHTYFNHGLWVKEFNNLAAHHFRRAGLHVLDAYSQSVLRTDDRSSKTSATGVVDCLHFAERPGGPAFGASNPEERDLLRTSLPYWSVQLLDFL
uniref:Uncharacterized protein n=2 Tax=Chrysotila carterae TaxID=13221 RepID=A0A6T0DR23_CHRCT|mmetsp:Transcript_8624/g.18751  ORF Transcript_8624/g.18751 Transcript_8624/m.18751 type:complete len:264 (-) Transcript_8624:264-1055(-)